MRTIDQIIQNIEDEGKQLEFLSTGFRSLDDTLDGGFMRREFVALGGYTGIGKSYLAGQFLWNIATVGFKTAYFSLEISDQMVLSRLIGSLANVKPTRIIRNYLTDVEREGVDKAKLKVITYGNMIDIYDDVYDLLKIGQAVIEGKYDFVVVDFLQNIVHRGEEYERLSSISLYLQQLAKKTNSCIMALSQLSNSAAKQDLLEYKGSGAIAMVADLGFFIKRTDNDGKTNDISLILRKNRRGFSGSEFNLQFQIPGGKIYEKK